MTGHDLIARRGLPMALDAERFVLGSCLVGDSETFEAVSSVLVPADFAVTAHRETYIGMLEIAGAGLDVNRAVLSQFLADRGDLAKVGGVSGLLDLEEGMPTVSVESVASYVAVIREKSALRGIIEACNDSIYQAAGGDSSEAVLARLDKRLTGLAETSADEAEWRTPGEVIMEHPGGLDSFLSPSRGGEGLATPWPALNRLICGLQAGDMVIVAGRPSHGKSVIGMEIGRHVAADAGVSVPYFSLEMSKESLVRRMISSAGPVDGQRMRHGHLNADERAMARSAVQKIRDIPLWIDYRPYNTVRMRQALKRLIAKLKTGGHPPLGAVIVDHFHLLQKAHSGQDERHSFVQASHDMKRMAKEFQVPFVVLCQLGRKPEDENREPALSDLAETSALEQDADVIMFTHRPECYVRNRGRDDLRGYAKWIVAKQRNGPTGAINMVFLAQYQQFREAADES